MFDGIAKELDDEDKVLVGDKLVEVVEAGDNLGAPASEVVSTHPEQLFSAAPSLMLISSLACITGH